MEKNYQYEKFIRELRKEQVRDTRKLIKVFTEQFRKINKEKRCEKYESIKF